MRFLSRLGPTVNRILSFSYVTTCLILSIAALGWTQDLSLPYSVFLSFGPVGLSIHPTPPTTTILLFFLFLSINNDLQRRRIETIKIVILIENFKI